MGSTSSSSTEIDELIFDLFEIGEESRSLVRRFFETVGRAEQDDAQAAAGSE